MKKDMRIGVCTRCKGEILDIKEAKPYAMCKACANELYDTARADFNKVLKKVLGEELLADLIRDRDKATGK